MVYEFVDCGNIKKIFWKMLYSIDLDGYRLRSELEQDYKESKEPIVMTIKSPSIGSTADILPEAVLEYFPTNFVEKYAINVASACPEDGDWDYTYGGRLALSNQLEKAIEMLKNFPDTRKAVCTLRLPEDIELKNPPCMTIMDFKIRDGLSAFAWLRSNDAIFGWPNNYMEVLYTSFRVASEVGVPLKKISTMSQSMHYYLRSQNIVDMAEGYLTDEEKSEIECMVRRH
ncbi:MAG: thymidylate synthase [Halobacteriota archaeon]|nr:thymidylate synthase [Halobacteriota archaeon]